MHSHVCGSHCAKFDDDDFNSFQGIACEGQSRHSDLRSSMLRCSVTYNFENKKGDGRKQHPTELFINTLFISCRLIEPSTTQGHLRSFHPRSFHKFKSYTDHMLQTCPTYAAAQDNGWPSPTSLEKKLYGSLGDLRAKAAFI